jgi:hypothetical protein
MGGNLTAVALRWEKPTHTLVYGPSSVVKKEEGGVVDETTTVSQRRRAVGQVRI